MKPSLIVAFVVFALVTAGCSSPGSGSSDHAIDSSSEPIGAAVRRDPNGPKPDSPKEKAAKRKALEQKGAIAEQRLAVAKLEMASWEQGHSGQLQAAEAELDIATKKLAQFDEIDAPLREKQAELNYQRSADAAAEADEELKQIELMYKGADLNDMTSEFVVARGRRNAERRAAQLKLEATSLDSLKKNTLPQDRRRLELDVQAKARSLESLKRDGEIARINKRIALMNAENELQNQRDELAKLDKPARGEDDESGAKAPASEAKP